MWEIFEGNLNESNEVQRGDLLLAEPLLLDDHFSRTVVLICEHNAEGSFGLVINRPTGLMVADMTEALFAGHEMYEGGPVERRTLHYIHTVSSVAGCIPLKDGLYWGGDIEEMIRLHTLGLLPPEKCRFCYGYSGWGPKQLDGEIEQNAWVVAKHNLAAILEMPPEDIWKEVLYTMGGRYQMLANFPIDPRLN